MGTLLPSFTRGLATIAELRDVDPSELADGEIVYVRGHTTDGDGGEGIFSWDESSVAADDDATIVALDPDSGTGRFLRQTFPSASSASLADTMHAINTLAKYTGKLVFNTTTGTYAYATGPDPSDAWEAIATTSLSIDHYALPTDATGGAPGDYLPFVDTSDSNANEKVLISDLITNAGIVTTTRALNVGGALSGGGTLAADRTFSLDVTGFTEDTTPDGAADFVLTYDGSAAGYKKVKLQNLPAAGGGETNTASNVGTAGVGIFKEKSGADLRFKKVNAGSSKVTVTDDTGNDEVDIDVAPANIDHNILLNYSANRHIDHTAVTLTAGIGIIGGGDISASRTFDLDLNSLTTDATGGASGDYLAVVDVSGSNSSDKVLVSDFITNAGLVTTARTLTAGAGLSGGGTLAADRTFSLDLNSLTTDATGGLMADYLGFVDVSDSNASNKVLVSDFLYNALNDATADTAPDMSADHVLTRDSSASAVKKVLLKYVGAGKQTFWVPAGAMVPRTTNGAAAGTTETTTNKVMLKTLDFDQTTQEYAQFAVAMPKGWNESTVTFVPYWTASSGTGGVVWSVAAVALADDDATDTAFGTSQTSTDTLLTANDSHIGPESSAITVAGSPGAGEIVFFQVSRETGDGSDTLTADAKLIGLRVHYTTDSNTDD